MSVGEVNKTFVELLCETRTVLRSAASSKSFIVFTLCPYLVAAVGAQSSMTFRRPPTAEGGCLQLNLRKKDSNQIVAGGKGTEMVYKKTGRGGGCHTVVRVLEPEEPVRGWDSMMWFSLRRHSGGEVQRLTLTLRAWESQFSHNKLSWHEYIACRILWDKHDHWFDILLLFSLNILEYKRHKRGRRNLYTPIFTHHMKTKSVKVSVVSSLTWSETLSI